ncbi:lytic murein transglycosylase [Rickettsiales bacterium]|nr:lytic murein transglycosylase [Rickettsiales bacterium]
MVPLGSSATVSAEIASEANADAANHSGNLQSEFRAWLVDFGKEAEKRGISDQTIYYFLKNVTLVPKVIKFDRKQPYKTKAFDDYIKNIVPDYRIQKARKLRQEHKEILDKVSSKYGVQSRFIVALWAIESNFGRNMGNYRLIDTLSTLSFEGRRAKFFREELMNTLKIIDSEKLGVDDVKGSWAGAMGQPQFMPSSFLELAVDHNGDGVRDIWNTKEDVFASIANYLSKRGWDDTKTWGREVSLPKNFDKSLIGTNIEKSLYKWSNLGIKKANGKSLPKRHDLKASLVRPDDNDEKTYLVYSNYKTILKWNRSTYFATAVGILSDGVDKINN